VPASSDGPEDIRGNPTHLSCGMAVEYKLETLSRVWGISSSYLHFLYSKTAGDASYESLPTGREVFGET
jgi:hypothetical protein